MIPPETAIAEDDDGALRLAAQRRQEQGRPRRGHVPGELGIWLFILGDGVVFVLLFAAFLFERSYQVEVFDQSSQALNVTIGSANTILMLTSSLFVVVGVAAIRAGRPQLASRVFLAAFAAGVVFLINKCFEYQHLLAIGDGPSANSFYMYFFVMTGIHAVHVIVGLLVLIALLRAARNTAVGPTKMRTIETGASYWHMVDLLWVVIFALLYLVSSQ
jgi:nitric oxide reductase NorE protein